MFSIVKRAQLVDLNFPPLKRQLFNRMGEDCRFTARSFAETAMPISSDQPSHMPRPQRSGEPPIWTASINSTGLGEFLEREIAMRRVEELVDSSMMLVLHDWQLYQAVKGKR